MIRKNWQKKRRFLLFLVFFVLLSPIHAAQGNGLPENADQENAVLMEEEQALDLHQTWNLICWVDPEVLLNELEEAGKEPALSEWCSSVEILVGDLSQTFPILKAHDPEKRRLFRLRANATVKNTQTLLDEWDFQDSSIQKRRKDVLSLLAAKIQEARELQATYISNFEIQSLLTRVTYTLQRRLILWNYCDALLTTKPGPRQDVSETEWRSILADVEKVTASHPYMETWCSYLRLNTLKQFSKFSPSVQREIAWQILGRLHPIYADASQRQFLSHEKFSELEVFLKRFASIRTEEDCLMASTEAYEKAEDVEAGNRLVMETRRFEMEQGHDLPAQLKYLETIYRNANLRLYVTKEFLNTSLPQPGSEERTIQDNILDRAVYGRGVSDTKLNIQMIPDENHFHIGFLVEGTMHSSTYSPDIVTVYNKTTSEYKALKEILFSSEGLKTAPAVANVQSQIQLQDLHTPLDGIPVLNGVAHGVARNQAEAKQKDMRHISEQKIRNEVCQRLDSEVESKLETANKFLEEKFFTALARFELVLYQMEARTTKDSAVIRLRLAGIVQPGACTARPIPPENSQINFQVHESAVNNFLQQFHLEGRTFTLEELIQYLRSRMPNTSIGERIVRPKEKFLLTFADQNAVTVKLANGEFTICVAVKELRVGRRSWSNFVVEAPYTVEGGSMAVYIHREGPVRLSGEVPASQQIGLRGVFSKVFPKTEMKNILPDQFIQNPHFENLDLDQLVVQDGWFGISFGPKSSTGFVKY